LGAALVGIAFGAAVWLGTARVASSGTAAALAALDTTRYVVVPFGATDSLSSVGESLREALTRWTGISVVDAATARESAERVRAKGQSAAQFGAAVAAGVGAGRHIRLESSPVGDSVRVHARLVDTRTSATIVERTVRIASDASRSDSTMMSLAEALLFAGESTSDVHRTPVGTRSVTARRAFVRGHNALDGWDLSLADSEFRHATELDPQFAQAFLWLAQTRQWHGSPSIIGCTTSTLTASR